MFPTLEGLYRPALLVLLSTGLPLMDEDLAMILESDDALGWPLVRWVVIWTTMKSLPILVMTMAVIEPFLICLLILTLTCLEVFAETPTPFASYAVHPALPCLRAASLAGRCKT